MTTSVVFNSVTALRTDAVMYEKRLEALAENAEQDGTISAAQVARCKQMAVDARDIAEKIAAFAAELGIA